ncbi:uncharacterized protein PG998_009909 [Apiospora kogelbergensis]|uniref:Uncharacterized protein n=1 Tax=Apiospora kogelbergensis TaxID=1337665 RepID=A0AAW0R8Y5_9PEZI
MSNSTVATRSKTSNSTTSTESIPSDWWAKGHELLSQGVGSQLELIKAFTSTSGFWARWFRYLVLLALALRILHQGARLFRQYGYRLFKAVKRLGGWAKGDDDNGHNDGQEEDGRRQDREGKNGEKQGPSGVCAVCREKLSSSQAGSPGLLPIKPPRSFKPLLLRDSSPTFYPSPPVRSYTAPISPCSRPSSRACSAPAGMYGQERKTRIPTPTATTPTTATRKKNFRNDRPLF